MMEYLDQPITIGQVLSLALTYFIFKWAYRAGVSRKPENQGQP